MAKETMKVIFKLTPYAGDCIAFLPEVLANPGTIFSYMHVGQGGEADKEFFYQCAPATPEEFHDLEIELADLYEVDLIVMKRLPNWWSWFDKFE